MFKSYRKKPLVVQAVQLTADNFPAVMAEMGRMTKHVVTVVHNGNNEAIGLRVHTLEGAMTVPFGWWIIRGVKGEMYPCEDEVFHMTYEPAYPMTLAEAMGKALDAYDRRRELC